MLVLCIMEVLCSPLLIENIRTVSNKLGAVVTAFLTIFCLLSISFSQSILPFSGMYRPIGLDPTQDCLDLKHILLLTFTELISYIVTNLDGFLIFYIPSYKS